MSRCPGFARGRYPRPGQKDRSFRPESDGPRGTTIRPLLPGLEPCCLVESGGEPCPAGIARGSLRARGRTACGGDRRNVGASEGKGDGSHRHLPRSGASSHEHFVKASGLVHVAPRTDSLASRVWALPFYGCPGPLRALSHRARQTTQKAHRVGGAATVVGEMLAIGSRFSGSASAPRVRNPAALVGAGHTQNRSGAVGALLAGYTLRAPANGAWHSNVPPGGVVRQAVPDLLRCSGIGAGGLVGAGDFCGSSRRDETVKAPREFVERLADAVCYAA